MHKFRSILTDPAIEMSTQSTFGYFPEYSGVTPQGLSDASGVIPGHTMPVTIAAAGDQTMTGDILKAGMLIHDPSGVASNVTTPSADEIIAALGGAGSSLDFYHRNNGTGIATVVAGSGVTLDGAMAVAPSEQRHFKYVVTGDGAVTVYSMGAAAF